MLFNTDRRKTKEKYQFLSFGKKGIANGGDAWVSGYYVGDP